MIVNVEFFHVYFPAMSENNNVKMKRVGYEGGAEGLRPVKECGEDIPRPCKEPKMTCVEPRSGNGKTFNKSGEDFLCIENVFEIKTFMINNYAFK